MKKLKNRKWYSTIKTIPDREFDLIIMTDMGYIFEATYQNGQFLTSVVRMVKFTLNLTLIKILLLDL